MNMRRSPLQRELDAYLTTRGLVRPLIADGSKVAEEASELLEAIAEGDLDHISHEIADVILSVIIVADHYGMTPEVCIAGKRILDRGRGIARQ